jgi:hypothetical protein
VLLDPSSGARQSVSLQRLRGKSRKKSVETSEAPKPTRDDEIPTQ